jgi:hypothetical protein
MKRIIQLILFSIIILISLIFYQTYLKEVKKTSISIDKTQNKVIEGNQNNLIQNLKYEVRLDQENQYIITSDLSEITYENNIEIVKMQKVTAIFMDGKNIPLIITSDKAVYNNSNYNTNFSDNIQIEYLNNVILSDKMDLDFNNNVINIFGNVQYDGIQGSVKTDNIKINLITKKIDIYMDKYNKNVEVITKE